MKNWEISNREDKDLKQIAKDLYDGKIFSDRHLSKNESVENYFMILAFIYPQKPKPPTYESEDNTLSVNRDNRLYDLLEREKDQKIYEEKIKEYPKEVEEFKKYLNNIGFIFEYMDKAGPMSLNGKPLFLSANILNKEDTEKMLSFYNTYKELRKEIDNF